MILMFGANNLMLGTYDLMLGSEGGGGSSGLPPRVIAAVHPGKMM